LFNIDFNINLISGKFGQRNQLTNYTDNC